MTRDETNIADDDDQESSSYCSECSADHGQETDKDEDSDDEITRDTQDRDVTSWACHGAGLRPLCCSTCGR
jgi:hypothetical protein